MTMKELPVLLLLAVVMSAAVLVAVALLSSLIVFLLSSWFDAIAAAHARTDFRALYYSMRQFFTMPPILPDEDPLHVCLARSPLRQAEYFCGFRGGDPQFTNDKATALTFSDMFAVRQVLARLEEEDLFVCVQKSLLAESSQQVFSSERKEGTKCVSSRL